MKACEHTTQLHDENFRDALVDAMAKVLDDHGFNSFNWQHFESSTKNTGRESPL